MADNDTTTRFKVDISELKSQFQEAQRQIKLVNSEFKAAVSGMDDWSKSSDGLNAKITQLNGVLDSERTKLNNLTDQYELVVRQYGENSRAAQDLAIKMNNQRAVVNNTERSLRGYVQQLDELENASEDAADNMDDLVDASNEAANNTTDLGDSAKDAGDGFTVLKGTIASFAGNVLSGLVSKLGEALSSMWNLADETKEFRDQMNKLDAAASTSGYAINDANKIFKKFYSVLGDETAANTATSNLLASGMAMEDLNKITHSMVGVWGQYGDSIPLDGLAESINETSRVGQITGNLADALNWAGINEDEFNLKLAECSSEQERQTLIANTLQNQYGDLADAYSENNESIMRANEANLEYEENLARLGEKIEPLQTELKVGFTNILSSFIDMLEGVDFNLIADQIRGAFEKISNIDWKSIGEKIESGIGVVKDIFNWILDNQTVILTAIGSIVTGLLAFNVATIIVNLVTAFKKLEFAQLRSAIAQKILNTAMFQNPVALVIAAVAALVAAFIILWNKSDKFREFWINLWEKIKEVVSVAIEKIKEVWNTMLPYITAIWEKIKAVTNTVGTAIAGFFSDAWEKIKEVWNNVQPYFKMVYDNIISPLVEIGKSMFNAFYQAWLLIKTIFSNAVAFFYDIFYNVYLTIKTIIDYLAPYFQTVWNTIKEVFSYVVDYFYNIFQAAWGVIQLVWAVVAPYFETVWENIKTIFSVVVVFFQGMFSTAWEAVKVIWKAATGFFKNIWDTIATIFSVVRNVMEGNWSDAWEAIKKIVNQWGDYFGDVWDGIKNIFSSVKDWFSETFSSAWDAVKEVFSNWGEFFTGLWKDIQDKFTLIGTNISDAIGGAVSAGINGVISLIEGTINSGIDLINGAINWINEIPGVDIGYFGSLNLPRLAKGGIVNSPTIAEIGEQGREAVIPLQNNLGWLKELASQLSNELNQNTGFNNSTSSSTVNNFYQTNNSPKSLSRLEIYRQSKNLLSFKGV